MTGASGIGGQGFLTKRLDGLPLVAHVLKVLRIREIVDEHVPVDRRSVVTTGQCVEALIAGIFLGSHALYRLGEVFKPFDVEVAFGWPRDAWKHFNDERLGKALDDLAAAGLMPINSSVLIEAVKTQRLLLSRIFLDSTPITVYGEYEYSREPDDPDASDATPHMTHGHNKSGDDDLKQVIYSLATTADGGVPLLGRVTSGNRSDCDEFRFLMQQLQEALPDLKKSTLVADSKFFSAENFLICKEQEFSFVTLVPKSVKEVRLEALAAFKAAKARNEIPVLHTREASGEVAGDSWSGASYDLTYHHRDSPSNKSIDIPVRLLVVEATSLRDQQRKLLERRRAKELDRLERISLRLNRTLFPSSLQAESALRDALLAVDPTFFKVEIATTSETRIKKRATRGRRRINEAIVKETVWRASATYQVDVQALEAAVAEQGTYVVATNLKRGKADDAEVFTTYHERTSIEASFRTLKGPLAVAPIFLKTPQRIAALGLVYLFALMSYAFLQRNLRLKLAEENQVIPGNIGWTDRPTTEVILRLFDGIFTVRNGDEGPPSVTNMSSEHGLVLRLLGHDLLSRSDVYVPELKPPAGPQKGAQLGKRGGAKKDRGRT